LCDNSNGFRAKNFYVFTASAANIREIINSLRSDNIISAHTADSVHAEVLMLVQIVWIIHTNFPSCWVSQLPIVILQVIAEHYIIGKLCGASNRFLARSFYVSTQLSSPTASCYHMSSFMTALRETACSYHRTYSGSRFRSCKYPIIQTSGQSTIEWPLAVKSYSVRMQSI